ncbi:NAD(P)-dependent oxidoreductase [Kribbella sp. NPDC051952]|uniref:NAD-dependent epimerase/dehydratase family protein n=1 Tax=Kribbella sp. NPDC051952 TaxID=3154851 RepID=UPI00343A9241
MKILLAGATGAIGTPLTRRLVARGHQVLGLTRQADKSRALRELGAVPVVADAMNRESLLRAVDGLTADAVLHELTALTDAPTRHAGMETTDRLRSKGSANLLAAAEVIGATVFVTQSIVLGYGYRDHGDKVLTEDDPFGQPAGTASDPHLAAMRSAEEQAFTAPVGIALRYGMFYGGDAEQMRPLLAKRKLPVAKGGLLPWIHHEDAAAATIAALEHGKAGNAYNIVDDLPVSWADMFTTMAQRFGAPAPRKIPRWAMRMAAPYVASFATDTSMRVANTKAKNELDWTPGYPTYQDGLRAVSRLHIN